MRLYRPGAVSSVLFPRAETAEPASSVQTHARHLYRTMHRLTSDSSAVARMRRHPRSTTRKCLFLKTGGKSFRFWAYVRKISMNFCSSQDCRKRKIKSFWFGTIVSSKAAGLLDNIKNLHHICITNKKMFFYLFLNTSLYFFHQHVQKQKKYSNWAFTKKEMHKKSWRWHLTISFFKRNIFTSETQNLQDEDKDAFWTASAPRGERLTEMFFSKN